MKYNVGDHVLLPFNETGTIVKIITDRLDWYPYKIRIRKAVMNKTNEIREFKEDQILFKYDKTKKLIIKLESVDPTGITIKSKKLSMDVVNDTESLRIERFILTLGDYMYMIDKNGKLIDRIVPHISNKKLCQVCGNPKDYLT